METVNKKYPLFCCFVSRDFLLCATVSHFLLALFSPGMCDDCKVSNLSVEYTAK